MNIVEIMKVIEDRINELRKEYEDDSVRIKMDNGDLTENSAFHALKNKMIDIKNQLDSLENCKYMLCDIKPILNDRITLASKIECDINGKKMLCVLAPWSNTEFEDKGFMFINIKSEIGMELLNKRNGDSIHVKDVSINNIKILEV